MRFRGGDDEGTGLRCVVGAAAGVGRRLVRARRAGACVASGIDRGRAAWRVRKVQLKLMDSRDPRVDAYVDAAAGFARPILQHIRAVVHEACPGVRETIKWRMPTFEYAGAILCSMAAFKQHASFGYWKHALVLGEGGTVPGMGSFGKLTDVDDLPPGRVLLAQLRKAMRLNEEGVPGTPTRSGVAKTPPQVPGELVAAFAMRKHARAAATFSALPPGGQREYAEWISSAKRAETRGKRVGQALEWLAEGKSRNWKYTGC
jgi:hypothetical protein